jgi:hypothetical protein
MDFCFFPAAKFTGTRTPPPFLRTKAIVVTFPASDLGHATTSRSASAKPCAMSLPESMAFQSRSRGRSITTDRECGSPTADCRQIFAECVVAGRDITILSDGAPTRTFCYITDAINGYLRCLLHGEFDCFNNGIDKPEISVAPRANLSESRSGGFLGETELSDGKPNALAARYYARRCNGAGRDDA